MDSDIGVRSGFLVFQIYVRTSGAWPSIRAAAQFFRGHEKKKRMVRTVGNFSIEAIYDQVHVQDCQLVATLTYCRVGPNLTF